MKQKFQATFRKFNKLPFSVKVSIALLAFVLVILILAAPEFMLVLGIMIVIIAAILNVADWFVDGSRRVNHYKKFKGDEHRDYQNY